MFDENKLKEIISRECAKNKSSRITSITKCNVDDPKNIYASVIGICTLSTYSSLINDESLNNALNKVVNLAKDNESFKNHLSSFTPQIWLSISSSAIGLAQYTSREQRNYGTIDFLNLGNVESTSRGI